MDQKWRFWERKECLVHRKVQTELLYTLLISLAPSFFAIGGLYLVGNGFVNSLMKTFGNGELILYSATLMAPVIYSTQIDTPVKKKHFFLIVAAILVGVGALYNLVYALGLINVSMFKISLGIVAVAIVLLYTNFIALAKREGLDIATHHQHNETKLIDEVRALREGRL